MGHMGRGDGWLARVFFLVLIFGFCAWALISNFKLITTHLFHAKQELFQIGHVLMGI